MLPINNITSKQVVCPRRVVPPLHAKVAAPRSLHSCVRKSAPVLAAFKGAVSKADDGYNSTTLSKLREPADPHKCEWTYNYGTSPVGVPGDMKFMPMVFGKDQFKGNGDLTGDAYSDLKKFGAISKHILGFNEPDGGTPDQSNLPVEKAVQYWYKVHYTAREAGAFLGSPAMTGVPYRTIGNKLHDASFDGCWLDNFLTQLAPSNLQGGTVDFICVHWYPEYGTMPTADNDQQIDAAVRALTSFLERVHNKYGKPVWLTEFSLVSYDDHGNPSSTSPPAVQAKFLTRAAEKMNGMDYVHRYAWFCSPPWKGTNVNLFDGSKKLLDPLGKAFQAL